MLWWLALVGCLVNGDLYDQRRAELVDADGDGVIASQDCDDGDPDASVETTWLRDADADGYGTSEATTACGRPDGYAAEGGDCDDASGDVHPGAPEQCNDRDDDCDGAVDDDVVPLTWYADADGDGYGNDLYTETACAKPEGYAAAGGDCDDDAAAVHPDATETCDGIDDDCDGLTDDADDPVEGQQTAYADLDGDGYGDSATAFLTCDPPAGSATVGGDCDDRASEFHPGALETDCYDPNDYNCDGSVGTDDGDGDGDVACTDCDDADASVHAGADESCNGADDDCDGVVDEDGVDGPGFFLDGDGDGYGDASVRSSACTAPSGFVADATDCDDASASVHPGGVELCDPVDADEDCDGKADDADASVTATTTYYEDADGDGYGSTSATIAACDAPAGYVAITGDCDDTSTAYHPGASESCTGTVDYNCDGSIGPTDSDGDGYDACSDCDDSDPSIHPGAAEVCDLVDDDCDGTVDVGAIDASTWYVDADGDGYGSSTSKTACTAPSGYSSVSGDCDDAKATVRPSATETCGTTADDDCDGDANEVGAVGCTSFYADGDGDGYGAGTAVCQCTATTSYSSSSGSDCDDTRSKVSPSGTETCVTSYDDDCDGSSNDPGAFACTTFYRDGDGDGYGVSTASSCQCSPSSPYTATSATDCDDGLAAVNPGGTETCATSYDDDCDGSANDPGATSCTTYYADADGDGYGGTSSECVCTATSGYTTTTSSDCDDTLSSVNPGAAEVCDDGLDDDCDGSWASCRYSGASKLSSGIELTGVASYDAAGPIALAGDVDGDGYGDLVVGGYGLSSTAGGAWLVRGPITASTSLSKAYATITGSTSSSDLGVTVAAGDVDGDGKREVMLSETYSSLEGIYVYELPSGSVAGTSFTARITSSDSSGQLGTSIAVGDVTGDGVDDVLAGAPQARGSATSRNGVLFVATSPISSGTTTLETSGDEIYDNSRTLKQIGSAVAIGDLDGDGLAEIAVGAVGNNGGVGFVDGGTLTATTDLSGGVILQGSSSEQAGAALAVGDADGDGYGDVMVGAPRSSTGKSSAGAVYLLSGPTISGSKLATAASSTLLGATLYEGIGSSVALGDVDGDGTDDLLVGAPGTSSTITGRAYLLYGPMSSGSLSVTSADAELDGGTTYDDAGLYAAIGDVDGDGLDDLLVGADRNDDAATDAGAVFVLVGKGL